MAPVWVHFGGQEEKNLQNAIFVSPNISPGGQNGIGNMAEKRLDKNGLGMPHVSPWRQGGQEGIPNVSFSNSSKQQCQTTVNPATTIISSITLSFIGGIFHVQS